MQHPNHKRMHLWSRSLPSYVQKQNRKKRLILVEKRKERLSWWKTITESTTFHQTGRSCSFSSPMSSVTDHSTLEKWNEGIPKRYEFCESEGLQKLGVHSDTGKRKGWGMYCYDKTNCFRRSPRVLQQSRKNFHSVDLNDNQKIQCYGNLRIIESE